MLRIRNNCGCLLDDQHAIEPHLALARHVRHRPEPERAGVRRREHAVDGICLARFHRQAHHLRRPAQPIPVQRDGPVKPIDDASLELNPLPCPKRGPAFAIGPHIGSGAVLQQLRLCGSGAQHGETVCGGFGNGEARQSCNGRRTQSCQQCASCGHGVSAQDSECYPNALRRLWRSVISPSRRKCSMAPETPGCARLPRNPLSRAQWPCPLRQTP